MIERDLKSEFLPVLFGKRQKMVTVPPGHKVVIVRPAHNANLGRCESGVRIADLGAECEFGLVMSGVADLAVSGHPAYVIWIVQTCVLNSTTAFESFVGAFSDILGRSNGVMSHTVYVPFSTAEHSAQVRRLIQAGVRVFESTDDGSCFAEVHKPDGSIVVGLAGREIAD